MSLRELESAIVSEARQVTGRPKLRLKDLQEWSTSEAAVRKNLTDKDDIVHCPLNGVWCAILKKEHGGK